MKKQNSKVPLMPVIVLCLLLAAGAGFLAVRAVKLGRERRQMDAQFEKELEESRKTIDQLKKQEAEIDADISTAAEEKAAILTPSPTPEPLLVSLFECQPGEVLPEERLYMDNPGIYFTASRIQEGDAVYQRISDSPSIKSITPALAQLRYLKMPYYDQKGEILTGEMVVNAEISQHVLDAFLSAFKKRQKMEPVTLEENLWTEPESWKELKDKFHLTYEDPDEIQETNTPLKNKETTEALENSEPSGTPKEAEARDAVFVEE